MPQHTEADDRKLSEHLRWEGEMFRLLVDNVKDYAIFIIDEERHITTWTKGAEHLLGYSESEILGKQLDIFFTPEDLASSTPAVEIRTAMEFGRGEDDRWHVRKDGSHFWCSGVVTPLLDETGCLRGFAKIMRDLTQKKAAEDKLAASDARFRRLLESNIIGVGVISDDGRIIEANDEYLRIVGYTREQLQAGEAFWTKVTPSEYRGQDEAAVAQATKHGACTPYEKEYQRPNDGRRIPVQIAFASLGAPSDAFLVYVIDLTSIKQVQKDLRQASQKKDEFLAMLGHELRNPLAPMLNAVHILRHAKRPADELVMSQSLHMIERQVKHMTRLVDDLLEVARITFGKVDLRAHALEIHPVMANVIETVRPLIDASRHQLNVSIAPEPIWVHADPVRLEQLLANLLTNASKYTDPGGFIWVAVTRDSDMAVFSVRDTGIGIDADALDRVFEPFEQIEDGRSRSQGGLGVGLSLVRRFAELHGGSVSASSGGRGCGSTFTVKLPIMDGAPAARGDVRSEDASSGRVRVLVVDDNIDAADSLRAVLEISGHEVNVAYTGTTGLELAKGLRPEVVLLDIGLPGLDGYQVAKGIRQDPQLDGMLLAAVTGYGQRSDAKRAYAAGFDRHLVKPVDLAKVFEVLDLVVQQRAST